MSNQVAGADVVAASSSGGTGAVSSVSNADGTLTISPTTGAVVAEIPSSVALPGAPTTTTPSTADNSTKIATTAMVQAAIAAAGIPTLPLTPANGGTGVANSNSSTVTITGAFSLAVTLSAATALTFPTSGTVTALGNAVTGSGSIVLATSPTLVTPVLGAATATSINGLTITSSTGTLTITNAKTLSVSNSLTLAGTDGTTMTFPGTSDTVVTLGATQTLTAKTLTSPGISAPTVTGKATADQVVLNNNAVTVTSNAGTVPVTKQLSTFTNSSAATMAITIATASATDGQMLVVRIYDFSGVAETIGWTNTENSTVAVPTTSNGSTTLPLTVGFMFNGATSKWRCLSVA